MIKSTIKTKMLMVVLSIAVISLLTFALITLFNIIKLESYILKSNDQLGKTAAIDSEVALKKQAQYYLLRLVKDQAAISNTFFTKVEIEVDMLAWYAAYLWNNQDSFLDSAPSYFTDANLKDPYLASVCKIAPNAVKEKVTQDIKIFSGMDESFKAIYPRDSNLQSIYLGTVNGLHKRYPWTSKQKKDYDPRKRSWYLDAVEGGKLGWTNLYISASDEILMVTCYKPVYSKEKILIGVIGADVTLTALNQEIINTQIGDLGYAFLVDKEGKLIASRELIKGNARWDQKLETENLLDNSCEEVVELTKKMIAGEEGVVQCQMDGEAKYVAYAPVKATNWSLGMVLPVSEIIRPAVETKKKIEEFTVQTEEHINQRIKLFYITLFIIFVVIIIIVSVVAIKLSKAITSPIRALDIGAKRIGNGDLDYSLVIDTGDELEELATTFNKMSCDLKEYIKNLKETTAAKEKIESELQIAKEIQVSFLPQIFPAFPNRQDFDIFAMMEPAKEVGGDFYDFFLIDDTKLFFLVGDVSGKGVPAALFMAIMKVVIKTEALRGSAPDEILATANNIIARDNESCMFATVFCGILNTQTGEILFANAGHNPPLICKNNKDFEYIKINKGFVLGPMDNMEFKTESLTLAQDEIIFLYTDGVNEAMNEENKQFTEEKLRNTLIGLEGEKIEKIIDGVRHEVTVFVKSAPQSDDITMLAVQYKG